MNRQKVLFWICLLHCGLLIAGTFYLIGYKTAYDRMASAVPSAISSAVGRLADQAVPQSFRTADRLLSGPPLLAVQLAVSCRQTAGASMRTVNLNWELDLPMPGQARLYETDSGPSFHGDGERYHVLEYAGDGRLEQALAEQATLLPSAENPVTEILDDLSVPADQRPDFADCGVFTAGHPSDDRNRLYLLVNSAGTGCTWWSSSCRPARRAPAK